MAKKSIYIFDVDGTLTDSRRLIDSGFKSFLMGWLEGKECYIVTGSDVDKTQEQLGFDLWSKFTGCFQNCGNVYYKSGDKIYENKWTPNNDLYHYLHSAIDLDKYTIKAGRHIEFRTGMINFSFLGRYATDEQRSDYIAWDKKSKQRKKFVTKSLKLFKNLDFKIGGDISIDIYPKGMDKSQVVNNLKYDKVFFFGDKCVSGNDAPLAKIVGKRNTFNVSGWEQTYSILKELKV
jgi:phosphomannomutase